MALPALSTEHQPLATALPCTLRAQCVPERGCGFKGDSATVPKGEKETLRFAMPALHFAVVRVACEQPPKSGGCGWALLLASDDAVWLVSLRGICCFRSGRGLSAPARKGGAPALRMTLWLKTSEVLLQPSQQRRGVNPKDSCGVGFVLAGCVQNVVNVAVFQFPERYELVARRREIIG